MNLHELIGRAAERDPDATALRYRGTDIAYAALADSVDRIAGGLMATGLRRGDRVAVYLPKQPEAVIAFFATAAAGAVFVPVNPQLRAAQVAHILRDSGAAMLITTADRAATLETELANCPALQTVVVVGDAKSPAAGGQGATDWNTLIAAEPARRRVIDADLAALLYTSGSTGLPKGVMLTHRNLVSGATSVAAYLGNEPADRLLTVLPFSFDYGFSQLSTAFLTGACVVLFDYLLARDVVAAVAREKISGLASVPPVWLQLARLTWPDEATRNLRYITNSGGALPQITLNSLRQKLPGTRVYLMYGLTEAFRSTYLDPDELDRRPTSIGKAIPNAEVLVVRSDGTACAVDEPGELVHRGALVARGYWNDPDRTAERFRPAPLQPAGAALTEIAVWSGDTVRADADGYLYFVGRRDELIKTSGYRVSPTEIEEVLYASGQVVEAIATGVPHPELGQAIVVVVVGHAGDGDTDELMGFCRERMANYMLPAHVAWRSELPRNVNGKIDRPGIAAEFRNLYAGTIA